MMSPDSFETESENVPSKVDFVDAKPPWYKGDSDRPDAAGFSEHQSQAGLTPAAVNPADEIPVRKRSLALNTPLNPNSKLYSMNNNSRGKVLILNQVKFDLPNYLERKGTQRDVERLYCTLPKLGFTKENIEVCEDLTSREIFGEAFKLQHDATLEQADCLVVIILTHGEAGDQLMASDQSFHLYDFIDKFTPTVLTTMAGKPKLFIVQACRGSKVDSGVRLQTKLLTIQKDSVDSLGSSEVFVYPEFADFLVVMSSHHGHYSFRNEDGSWLIQELCNVIDRCDPETDSILDILLETNASVAKRISTTDEKEYDQKKQVSSFYGTLTKQLYFQSNRRLTNGSSQ